MQSTKEIGEGFKLFYIGSENRNGVGIILDEELKKQVVNVQRISDRLMMAKIILDTEVVKHHLNICSAIKLRNTRKGKVLRTVERSRKTSNPK